MILWESAKNRCLTRLFASAFFAEIAGLLPSRHAAGAGEPSRQDLSYRAVGFRLRAAGQVRAVNDVSLTIEAGETLGLVGESGSGKSTLGRMLLRLIEADSGEVIFDGQDVLRAGGKQLRRLRRDMQIIFQDPFGSLDPRMTVETDCLRAVGNPWQRRRTQSPPACRRSDARGRTGRIGSAPVSARVQRRTAAAHRYRAGVGAAAALHRRRRAGLSLDVSVGAQIVNLLKQLQREFQLTYLFISHSMPIVRYLADRIAVMQRGELVEIGTTEQITTAPHHPYTRTSAGGHAGDGNSSQLKSASCLDQDSGRVAWHLRGTARPPSRSKQRLTGKPASIAAEKTSRSQHAMARNDDGDGIVVVRLSDGAKAVGIAHSARDFGIGAGLAVGNPQQLVPAAFAKFGSAKIQIELEVAALPAKYSSSCCRTDACASQTLPMRLAGRRWFRQSAIELQRDQR